MALRRLLGWSDGELMRSDSKPCSRLMRQTAAICTVGGGLGFWVLCRMHYGERITVPRSLRWAACGALSVSSTSALLVRLFSPECEPQNIAAYDKGMLPNWTRHSKNAPTKTQWHSCTYYQLKGFSIWLSGIIFRTLSCDSVSNSTTCGRVGCGQLIYGQQLGQCFCLCQR